MRKQMRTGEKIFWGSLFGVAGLIGCAACAGTMENGGSGMTSEPATTAEAESSSKSPKLPEVLARGYFAGESCIWDEGNPRPFYRPANYPDRSRKYISLDGRCTTTGGSVPIYREPSLQEDDLLGSLSSGDVVESVCMIRNGPWVANDSGKGSTHWVELKDGGHVSTIYTGFTTPANAETLPRGESGVLQVCQP